MSEISQQQPAYLSPNQRAWRRFKRNKPAVASLWFLALLALTMSAIAILQWSVEETDAPSKIRLAMRDLATTLPGSLQTHPEKHSEVLFAPPDEKFWFGTDIHGRDLFARIFAGARVSLLVGFIGTAVAFIIGVTWGAIAGYIGGKWDSAMMRFVDILYSLPSIIFVIVLITTLDQPLKQLLSDALDPKYTRLAPMIFLFIGLGAVSWLTMARIVRGQVLSLRHRQFVDASRALGASHARILRHHILPNIYGIVIVYLTLTLPAIILYESFLSYLGLGIQPPMASWGTLIAEGAGQLNSIRIYWWLIVFPAGALTITLLALNFLGDGLRDAFDPRAEQA